MPKIKLDAALLSAIPVAEKAPDSFAIMWDNSSCFARFTQAKTRMDQVLNKEHWSTADKIVNCVGSWDTIPYVLGAIHRIQEDGGQPLVKLGLTIEQERDFRALCRAIREKLNNKAIVSGQPEQRTTLTKQIYDSLVSNHF